MINPSLKGAKSSEKGSNRLNLRTLQNADVSALAGMLPPNTSLIFTVDSAGNKSMGIISTKDKPVVQDVKILNQVRTVMNMAKKLSKILAEGKNSSDVLRILYTACKSYTRDDGTTITDPIKFISEMNPRSHAQSDLAAIYRQLQTLRDNQSKFKRLSVIDEMDKYVYGVLEHQVDRASRYLHDRIIYLLDRTRPDEKEKDARLRFGVINSVFLKVTTTMDLVGGMSVSKILFPNNLSKNFRIARKEFLNKDIMELIVAMNSPFIFFYTVLFTDEKLFEWSLGRTATKIDREKFDNLTLPLIRNDTSDLYGTKQSYQTGNPGEVGYNQKLALSKLIGYLTGVVPLGEDATNFNEQFLEAQFSDNISVGTQIRDIVAETIKTKPDHVWKGYKIAPNWVPKQQAVVADYAGEAKTHEKDGITESFGIAVHTAFPGPIAGIPLRTLHFNYAGLDRKPKPDSACFNKAAVIAPIYSSKEKLTDAESSRLETQEGKQAKQAVTQKLLRQPDKESREVESKERIVDANQPLTREMVRFFDKFSKALPDDLKQSVRVKEEITKAKQALMRLNQDLQRFAYQAMKANVQQAKLADFSELYASGEDDQKDDDSDFDL